MVSKKYLLRLEGIGFTKINDQLNAWVDSQSDRSLVLYK